MGWIKLKVKEDKEELIDVRFEHGFSSTAPSSFSRVFSALVFLFEVVVVSSGKSRNQSVEGFLWETGKASDEIGLIGDFLKVEHWSFLEV